MAKRCEARLKNAPIYPRFSLLLGLFLPVFPADWTSRWDKPSEPGPDYAGGQRRGGTSRQRLDKPSPTGVGQAFQRGPWERLQGPPAPARAEHGRAPGSHPGTPGGHPQGAAGPAGKTGPAGDWTSPPDVYDVRFRQAVAGDGRRRPGGYRHHRRRPWR